MFQPPNVKVFRVNLRPLLTPEEWERVNPTRVLQTLRQAILKRLKDNILQETFSPAAKRALAEGMRARLGPNSVTVVAVHTAFRPLLEGQKAGQMAWLTKAKAPIPIVTDEGELIFRSATPKSMANGSWYHPGRAKTGVLERARAEARDVVRKRVRKDIVRQLRVGLSRGK